MFVRFSGIVGLVVFLFGLTAALLVQGFDQPLLVLHMILGLVLLAVWLFGYGLKNISDAGAVIKGRTARFSANVVLYSIVFLGLLIVINWLISKYDQRWDLTERGVFSLSPQSISAIASLKKPLKMVAFKGLTQMDDVALKDLLDLYKHHSTKVEARLVDARSKPHLIDQYEMKQGNAVYLEYGEGDKKAVSRINETDEQAITNSIIKLTRGEAKKIYYVEGHEEPDINDAESPKGLKQFASAIQDEHLTIEGILLGQLSSIPEDAAAVVLCSPKKALLPEEKKLLIDYAEKGGRLLLFTDPRAPGDVREIATHFGVEVGNDVIIDQIQRLFAAPTLGAQPIVRDYAPHAITKNLKAKDVTIFNIASSVSAPKKDDPSVTYTELAKTGATAWAEKDMVRVFDQEDAAATYDQGSDAPGPVSIVVSYEKKLTSEKSEQESEKKESSDSSFDKSSRIVVFGDSDWIENGNIAVYANRDFVLSSVNWLVGEEGGVSIGKKTIRESNAPLTREDFMFLLATSFLVPECILIFGLFVWWRRKTVGA